MRESLPVLSEEERRIERDEMVEGLKRLQADDVKRHFKAEAEERLKHQAERQKLYDKKQI